MRRAGKEIAGVIVEGKMQPKEEDGGRKRRRWRKEETEMQKGRDGDGESKHKTERRKSSEGEHGLIRYSIHTNSHPFTISNRGAHPVPLPRRQGKLSQAGPARDSPSCQQLAFGHA